MYKLEMKQLINYVSLGRIIQTQKQGIKALLWVQYQPLSRSWE